MTFEEATLLLPDWVQLWLNVLLFGAFILPLTLFIWKQTRLAALLTLLASVAAGFTIMQMFENLGMVRLLGLPHVILWTPIVIFLIAVSRRESTPNIPKWILRVIALIITISLVFDYYDVIRYFLGDTASIV